jgi:hypothetical protein
MKISEAPIMSSRVVRGALLLFVVVQFSIPARADRPTNISVSPASGTYGGVTTLQATLTTTGRPATNQNIDFALNGFGVGSATTNSNGVATLSNVNLAGLTPNTYVTAITAVFAGGGNLRSSRGTATLTVNPAPLTVRANNATKLQGQPNPLPTVTYTGFVNGDTDSSLSGTLSFTTDATTTSPAGVYTVTPGGLTSTNYVIAFVSGTLTVNNLRSLTITANNAIKLQGQPNPLFTVTYAGFVNGDTELSLGGTLSFTTDATETSPAGVYTVTPGGLTSANYVIAFVSGTLTVNNLPSLTITANNAIKLQGQPNPAFTVTYTGFVNGDTESSLGGTLSFDTAATTTSPVGAYTVTPKDLTSSNYLITFVNGTLNVVHAYVTDQNIYTPPDYLTFLPPAVGDVYTDTPGFYTPIKRMSDSMNTPDVASGSPRVVLISTEYSTMSPFNQDNTKLLLMHLSYFGLYDGTGVFLRNLPLEINASTEPRWSRSDPNVFYYVRGNQLKQYNVEANTMSVVHAFSEYSAVSGKGKSDISFDGDHFVLVGDRRYVFVYEISTDSKGPVFDTGGVFFNNVTITPNGNVTISWNSVGSNRYQGIELFDRNMNFLRQLVRADGHMDLSRDSNGDEVMLWANANDPVPICNNGVVKVRLADATQTCLVKFDWSLALHISATDDSGWVFVETYAPGDPIPPAGWFKYTDESMQVKLDASEVRRFAHHRSRPLNSYTYQPKLSISRDGSKLAYASNFGLQQILGNPTEYSDAYIIDMSVISPDSVRTASTPGP